MNKVTGKILLHETGVGIPNLVVTVYDVDSNTLPEDAMQSKQASLVNFWEQLQGNRLGSVLTDQDGEFVLEYEDKEVKEERPDLLLFVTAPEGPGLDGCFSDPSCLLWHSSECGSNRELPHPVDGRGVKKGGSTVAVGAGAEVIAIESNP